MKYKGFIVPRSGYLSRISQADITNQAKTRLKWMDYYRKTQNARLTCRHFGISPDTFYRWKRRYQPLSLKTLEDNPQSRRPKKLRQPTTPAPLVERVRQLREEYPRWGKEKITVLLKREGWEVSISTIGRTLTRLKERGVLKEPEIRYISAKKRFLKRKWAVRKPKDYPVSNPGDLIQIDTLDIRPLPGIIRKQFTARDVVSKWDVIGVFGSATSFLAAKFLDHLIARLPFTLKALQIDGGSEFKGEFEAECQRRGVKLFVLPPRSPKLNGCVERSNRTHTEEFYEVKDIPLNIEQLNHELNKWERIYNTIRPHKALGNLTPLEYITNHQKLERSVYGMY